MKKLAIMFVMLLGSIATMQAQSFDFTCETIDNGGTTEVSDSFTAVEMELLILENFEASINPLFEDAYAQTRLEVEYFIFSGIDYFEEDLDTSLIYYLGYNDGIQRIFEYRTLEDAIAAFNALFPVSDNNG